MANKNEYLKICDSKSQRSYDANGYLVVKHNPIAKCGVYPYTGASIGLDGLEANKIYQVYRPMNELKATMSEFEGMPITLTHQWVEGHNVPKVVGTVSGDVTSEGDYLFADLKIIDKDAQRAIETETYNELSPGYLTKYEKEAGEYNGEPYDFIQRDIHYNHLALVSDGRTGSSLRVMDSSENLNEGIKMKKGKMSGIIGRFSKAIDEIGDIKEDVTECVETRDDAVDKRKLIDEIGGIMKSVGADDEIIRTVIKKAEELAYNGSETNKTDDEDVFEEKKEKEVVKATDFDKEGIMRALRELEAGLNEFFREEETEPQHQATTDASPFMAENIASKVRKEMVEAETARNKAYLEVSQALGQHFPTMDSKGRFYSPNDIYSIGVQALAGKNVKVEDAKSAFQALAMAKTVTPTEISYRATDNADDDYLKKLNNVVRF